MVTDKRRIEKFVAFSFIAAVMIGCAFVLKPFVLSLLWAAVLCVVTWPLYKILLKFLPNHPTIVASVMALVLLLVLFIPFILLGLTFTDSIRYATEWLETQKQAGLPLPPEWIERIPLIGNKLSEYWTRIALSEEPFFNRLQPAIKTSGLWILRHSLDLGQGIFNLTMGVLIAFFLYRDGKKVSAGVTEIFRLLSPNQYKRIMELINTTIQSVIYGTIGTALIQAAVAGIGFVIAGLPSPLLLAMFTFFLSFVALPPLVWIGAAAWLFAQGHNVWGIFMILYGLLVISSVDNVVKPYIISRGSKLPFIVTFIGVLGGIATFGFIGVFLGPTLLAVGYALTHEILTQYSSTKGSKANTADLP